MKGLLAVVVVVVAGCGGSTDYLGVPPGEAAPELTDRGCDVAFSCGVFLIQCDPPMVTHQTGEQFYGTREGCEADLGGFYSELLTGCANANLTEQEIDTMNDCLDAGYHCPSESEYDEFANAVCGGNPAPWTPDACVQASPIFTHCSACAEDPAAC